MLSIQFNGDQVASMLIESDPHGTERDGLSSRDHNEGHSRLGYRTDLSHLVIRSALIDGKESVENLCEPPPRLERPIVHTAQCFPW